MCILHILRRTFARLLCFAAFIHASFILFIFKPEDPVLLLRRLLPLNRVRHRLVTCLTVFSMGRRLWCFLQIKQRDCRQSSRYIPRAAGTPEVRFPGAGAGPVRSPSIHTLPSAYPKTYRRNSSPSYFLWLSVSETEESAGYSTIRIHRETWDAPEYSSRRRLPAYCSLISLRHIAGAHRIQRQPHGETGCLYTLRKPPG